MPSSSPRDAPRVLPALGSFALLVLAWCWPRSYGPSLEAPLLLLGLLCAASWFSLARAPLPVGVWAWLALLAGLAAIGPSSTPLYRWMLVPVVVALALALSVGKALRSDDRGWGIFLGAIAVAAAFNTAVAMLQFAELEQAFYPWVSLDASARPYGNLRQPNHLATLCAWALAAAWWGARTERWPRLLVLGLAFVAALGLAASASRSGMLQAFVVAGLAWRWPVRLSALRWGLRLAPLWIVLLSLGLSQLALWIGAAHETLTHRSSAGDSAHYRLLHWQAALALIADHPWLGVGWREFRWARFMEDAGASVAETAENAHNLVLHLAVELGVPGMLALVVPALWALAKVRPWRAQHPREQSAVMLLLIVAVHSLVEYPLWYLIFLLPSAIAWGALVLSDPDADAPRWRLAPGLAAGLAVTAVVGLWDYDRAALAVDKALFTRPAEGESPIQAAQRSLWFRPYAEQALIGQVTVTPENATQVLAVSERVMRLGPEPRVLNPRIAAMCLLGQVDAARTLAARYERAYPKDFAAFRAGSPAGKWLACGLGAAPP